jgi:signal transduction histidine kinase
MSDSSTAPVRPQPSLSSRLLLAHDEERRRIAAHLHDDLGQQLALLAVTVDSLRQQVPASLPQLAAGLRDVFDSTRAIAAQVQKLSQRLHPSRLEHLGLAATLRGLCAEVVSEGHLAVIFASAEIPASISPASALAVFRAADEVLRMFAQHARSTSVDVSLRVSPDHLRLTILNGETHADAIRTTSSEAIATLHQRVKSVQGRLLITSAPGRGTRVEALVPLSLNEGAGRERTARRVCSVPDRRK